MQTVWKFPVSAGTFTLLMPADAQALAVQMQHGEPQLWALVSPDAPMRHRTFTVVGTGHSLPVGRWRYVGTFQQLDFGLVWHLFEEGGEG